MPADAGARASRQGGVNCRADKALRRSAGRLLAPVRGVGPAQEW